MPPCSQTQKTLTYACINHVCHPQGIRVCLLFPEEHLHEKCQIFIISNSSQSTKANVYSNNSFCSFSLNVCFNKQNNIHYIVLCNSPRYRRPNEYSSMLQQRGVTISKNAFKRKQPPLTCRFILKCCSTSVISSCPCR